MRKLALGSAAALLAALLSACGTHDAGSTTNSTTSAPAASAASSAAAPAPVATALVEGGATLPAGPELAALQNSCQACHSFGMVTQQRLSAATWKAEVAKMRRFGAPLAADKQAAVVAYLAKNLGPTAPRSGDRETVTAPPITYTAAPPAQ